MKTVALLLLCAGLAAALPVPAAAQPAAGPPVTATQAIETAKQAYGPPDARAKETCPPHRPGEEIVVCAEVEDQDQFRVRSSGELDPAGAGARGGVPRAPDVGTTYPGAVVARGCFIPPCPPPMPKIIDLKAIPEAPPGSDADRVGRGLAPRGNDGSAPAPGGLPPLAGQADEPDRPPRPPESASPAEPR
ncbi:hypothetical protein [Tsuneonella sp. SYSU-LHT278]|uniref:hypothetical protein n=1 Tax=Tsuneonella sediminis TaxID=3416089 RepID=UPI003F7A6700